MSIYSKHIWDAISIDVKIYFNLWNGADIHEFEFAKLVAVLHHWSLNSIDLSEQTKLVVRVDGEGQGFPGVNSLLYRIGIVMAPQMASPPKERGDSGGQ